MSDQEHILPDKSQNWPDISVYFVFSVIENTATEKWMVILKEKRAFVHIVFFSYLVVPSKWIEE